MDLPACSDRIVVNSTVFACRNERVFSNEGMVDEVVCRACEFGGSATSVSDANSRNKMLGTSQRARLLAVPAASLQRDPSGWHKSAYARVIAGAFKAELVLVADEDEVVREVNRLRPELLLTMNIPWYSRYSESLFWRVPKRLPIVSIHDDCRREMHPRLEAVLNRSAAFISPVRAPVVEEKQFIDMQRKLCWLPYFIPRDAPVLALNRRAQKKCLITGAVNSYYPIREKACRQIPAALLARLVHPGYWNTNYSSATTGVSYLQLLQQYLAGLTCGSVYRCAVMKYLEIPYSGALLIAEDVPDLGEMGFSPGETFVPVDDQTDFSRLISQITDSPHEFMDIRIRGQELILARHTESVRTLEAQRLANAVLRSIGLQPSSDPCMSTGE